MFVKNSTIVEKKTTPSVTAAALFALIYLRISILGVVHYLVFNIQEDAAVRVQFYKNCFLF